MTDRIKGILFDKDGTLFDFEASWAAVIDKTLVELTTDVPLQDAMAEAVGYRRAAGRFMPGSPCVAGSVAEVAGLFVQLMPDRDVLEIERTINRTAAIAVADGALVAAVADLPGFLNDLRQSGYRLGVATHDSEDGAVQQLEQVGALNQFDFVAGYDSGHGLKPGPGMLLAFATATGLQPSEIIMVGDSLHDLGVAPAAGAAAAIGVLTGPADRADLEPHADHILDSIAGLPGLLAQGL